MSTRPKLIALDWGTSSLRAYLLGADGACLEHKQEALGILKIAGGAYDAAYLSVCGPWQRAHGLLPVVASGMIGSRQGWLEAPYVACPAAAAEIAAQLAALSASDGARVHFVPGLAYRNAHGVPDVMRGEETQLLGAGAAGTDAIWVLPGTHSKWVRSERGRIAEFSTYMTGELFALLREHSILGKLMSPAPAPDDAAFHRGLAYGRSAHAGLARALFSARSLGLFSELPQTGVADYLSGLLIGAEIGDALAAWPNATAIALIGDAQLCARYELALADSGLAVTHARPDAAARGLWHIARAAALV